MALLNPNISAVLERELILKLYDYLSYNTSFESIHSDIEYGHLSYNVARDKNGYYWFLDENCCVAINLQGRIIDYVKDKSLFEVLFL